MTDFFERAEPMFNLYTQGNYTEALHLTLAESATGRGMHGVIVAGGKGPRFQMTPGSVNAFQPGRALPDGKDLILAMPILLISKNSISLP